MKRKMFLSRHVFSPKKISMHSSSSAKNRARGIHTRQAAKERREEQLVNESFRRSALRISIKNHIDEVYDRVRSKSRTQIDKCVKTPGLSKDRLRAQSASRTRPQNKNEQITVVPKRPKTAKPSMRPRNPFSLPAKSQRGRRLKINLEHSILGRSDKSWDQRQTGRVDPALIQYAETEMDRHEQILENTVQVDHSLSGRFLMPSNFADVQQHTAAEKRALATDKKVFGKPLSGIDELKLILSEVPSDLGGREKMAYFKWIRRKLDAFFALRGETVTLPPPKLMSVLYSNASKAKRAATHEQNEKFWKSRLTRYEDSARGVMSLLQDQRKNWLERKHQKSFAVPAYIINSLHTKPLVEWDRQRTCTAELDGPFLKLGVVEANEVRLLKVRREKLQTRVDPAHLEVVGGVNGDYGGMFDFNGDGKVEAIEHDEMSKEEFAKQVRAKRFLGAGINLPKDAFMLSKYEGPARMPSSLKDMAVYQRRKSSKNNVHTDFKKSIGTNHIPVAENADDKALRAILRTNADRQRDVHTAVLGNLKKSMGTMSIYKDSIGAKLESFNYRDHTISYPSPFKNITTSKMNDTESKLDEEDLKNVLLTNNKCSDAEVTELILRLKTSRQHSRMPSYFHIDEEFLESFLKAKGRIVRSE